MDGEGRKREREKLGQITRDLLSRVGADLLAELEGGKKLGRVSTCREIGRGGKWRRRRGRSERVTISRQRWLSKAKSSKTTSQLEINGYTDESTRPVAVFNKVANLCVTNIDETVYLIAARHAQHRPFHRDYTAIKTGSYVCFPISHRSKCVYIFFLFSTDCDRESNCSFFYASSFFFFSFLFFPQFFFVPCSCKEH